MGIEYQAYQVSSQVPSNCNSILFRNQGTSVLTIDNINVLQPGQSFAVQGNAGEYITHVFSCVFAAVGTNNLAVTYKVFIGIDL